MYTSSAIAEKTASHIHTDIHISLQSGYYLAYTHISNEAYLTHNCFHTVMSEKKMKLRGIRQTNH